MLVLVAVIAGNVVRGTSAGRIVRVACSAARSSTRRTSPSSAATTCTAGCCSPRSSRSCSPRRSASHPTGSAYTIGAVVVVAVWAIVCAGWLRFDQTPATRLGVSPISDWRIVLKSQVVHDEQSEPGHPDR